MFPPTWITATVCTVIISMCLLFERFLHYIGKVSKRFIVPVRTRQKWPKFWVLHGLFLISVGMALKHKKNFALFEALLKLKEELMLLGFISLLLSAFQGAIQRICIKESLTHHQLPCKIESNSVSHISSVRHYQTVPIHFTGMRTLLATGSEGSGHCKSGKVPLLLIDAIHHLHMFIFVMAVTQVVLNFVTVVLGQTQMTKWKSWEAKIQQEDDTVDKMVVHGSFIKKRFKGNAILSWLHSFGKQFYDIITIDDYRTIRLGFIMWRPEFNFFKYMIRALEADYKRVIGISWYFWALVVVFLLLNLNGWHVYFWISFIPLILLFVLGAKLENIIDSLAKKVVDKKVVVGELVVIPSDDLFWFNSPNFVLFLIHYILFQNAFEISYFFWVLTTYSFDSCIMGNAAYIIPRLVFSVIIQVVCSYSTLPLYAIVSHMGSRYKKAILPEYMHETFEEWVTIARTKTRHEKERANGGVTHKLWAVFSRNKAENEGNKTDALGQSGQEMQEIQREAESKIEIGME